MLELYMIIAQKIFPDFWGLMPPAPISYAYVFFFFFRRTMYKLYTRPVVVIVEVVLY